jgi:hypothetical protein
MTAQTLGLWAKTDQALGQRLLPELERLKGDPRKSVSKTAAKVAAEL